MFGGEEAVVTLEIPEWMVGIVLDRFGRETDIRRVECAEKKVSRCQNKTGKEAENETEMERHPVKRTDRMDRRKTAKGRKDEDGFEICGSDEGF